MNFSFFKNIAESETKVLWYLSVHDGKVSIPLEKWAKIMHMDFQQLRRTTNKLQHKGFISKYRDKAGRGSIMTYTLVRSL